MKVGTLIQKNTSPTVFQKSSFTQINFFNTLPRTKIEDTHNEMSAAILSTNPPRNSLFIGDLSIFCTEDDLRDLFSPFGELLEIKIMKSEDKGRSLSYGFVKFSDPACASRALNELQHKLLHGRNLR